MSKITTDNLLSKSRELYLDYGLHVIEDRAIVGEIDGLKPVTRRLLWSAYDMGLRYNSRYTKAAKVAADAMGNYHPHGSSSLEQALVTAVNLPVPLFDGSGNWGTMVDPPAASRYIECRLSKYSEKVFFDKFYLVVNPTIPTYDDSGKEPLILPALIPNILVNGNFGISPGIRSENPSHTFKSVIKTLIATLKAGKASPQICLNLEMVTDYGGVLRKTKTLKKDLLAFYKTGVGKFVFDSRYEDKGNSIRFNKFAKLGPIDKVLETVKKVDGVSRVRDDSSLKDRYNAYTIEFKKTLKGYMRDKAIAKIVDAFSGTSHFNLNAIERKISDTKLTGEKKLLVPTIPEIIDRWIAYRIQLEKTACSYWIKKRNAEIDHLNLMRLAVKNRAFIIKALDKPFDDEQLAAYLAKHLKITVEQANIILDLKIRALKSLEDKKLVKKIKELKDEIKSYKQRIAKPRVFIANQLKDFYKEFKDL